MAQNPSGSSPTPFSSKSVPPPPSPSRVLGYTNLVPPYSSTPQGSGSAFETYRTVDIAVSISADSAPACSGYDVRQYNTPVTTACPPTVGPSATAASHHSFSVSSGSRTVYSHFPTSSGYHSPPQTTGTASGSYRLSPEANAEQDECQSEYSGSCRQDNSEEEVEYQKKYGCPSRLAMLQRFLTVDPMQDSVVYMARLAIRSGHVKDGDVPPLPWK